MTVKNATRAIQNNTIATRSINAGLKTSRS